MGCRELQVNDYFIMADSVSGTDAPYYALADANKNITEYFDSNGNVVAHYEYSPFGKITQSSGTMASNFDYRFSSEVFDNETGLSYYNFRYYSAELGRWLSRDPVEELGHVLLKFTCEGTPYSNEDNNPYRHTNNNPINFIDSNGEIVIEIISIVIGAYLAYVGMGCNKNEVEDLVQRSCTLHCGYWCDSNTYCYTDVDGEYHAERTLFCDKSILRAGRGTLIVKMPLSKRRNLTPCDAKCPSPYKPGRIDYN